MPPKPQRKERESGWGNDTLQGRPENVPNLKPSSERLVAFLDMVHLSGGEAFGTE
jgi:hypothetical protein